MPGFVRPPPGCRWSCTTERYNILRPTQEDLHLCPETRSSSRTFATAFNLCVLGVRRGMTDASDNSKGGLHLSGAIKITASYLKVPPTSTTPSEPPGRTLNSSGFSNRTGWEASILHRQGTWQYPPHDSNGASEGRRSSCGGFNVRSERC